MWLRKELFEFILSFFFRDDPRLSELIVVESLTRDLVGQVLHVFLHLDSNNTRQYFSFCGGRNMSN